MGITVLKMGKASPLQPGERVLHEQRSFRAVSSICLPSYRIGCNLPPLYSISLLVTDRRCLVLGDFLHCMTQEIVMWHAGRNPAGDPETITGVCSTSGLFGRCLEIRSHNPTRRQRWLWSPNLTLRFFFRNPKDVEKLIIETVNQVGAANQTSPTLVGKLGSDCPRVALRT